MYLHLGRDVSVLKKSIIGIFDLDTTSFSKRTREFLASSERGGTVVNVIIDEIPKSFIICEEGGKKIVYISQISSATLKKRAESYKMAGSLI